MISLKEIEERASQVDIYPRLMARVGDADFFDKAVLQMYEKALDRYVHRKICLKKRLRIGRESLPQQLEVARLRQWKNELKEALHI